MMRNECDYERSPNILINTNKNPNPNLKKIRVNNYQHSLNTNTFDPFNFSPPNEFKIKLYSRIYNYEKQIK
jgi:hypothetical protein